MSAESGLPPGVIFDLDGTLMDTAEDLTSAVNVLLAELGRTPLTAHDVAGMIGEGLALFLQRATGIGDPDAIAALIERYRPLYAECLLDKTGLFPGIPALLDTLVSARMPLAVLSNKPHIFLRPLCQRLLGPWPFVRQQGTVEGVPSKPDPTAALSLAHAMNRAAESVFLVGDSDIDVVTAHRAGMIAVAVTWGYGDRGAIIAARPMALVETPIELAEVLMSGGLG